MVHFGIEFTLLHLLRLLQNLNSPSFESSAGYVYELKPQAKVGAAWIPIDTVTVELGYDLTKNEGAVPSSKSQYWNVGAEWDAFNILALRIGAFENTAQSDIGLVGTFGLGLNMWAARLDVGGAVSTKTVTVDGSETPTYAMVSAALAVDF